MAKVLVGFMGSGKSTIAGLLDPSFVDMDAYITEQIGTSITEYFSVHGEEAFRKIEQVALVDLLKGEHVLSTGGGVVIVPANRELLSQHDDVVYLQADFETLYQRIKADKSNQRPLFLSKTKEELEALFEERRSWYEAVADQIINVVGKTPKEIMEAIK